MENLAQVAGRCNRHGEDSRPHPVYLIDCGEEDLAKLTEIAKAGVCCNGALRTANEKGLDPLGPEVVELYYNNRYGDSWIRDRMPYPVSRENHPSLPENTNLLELLSFNNPGRRGAEHRKDSRIRPLAQSFATAGELFEAIESPAAPVLVPYGAGKALIARLERETDPKTVMALLRRAQQYSVNLFLQQKGEAGGQGGLAGALRLLPCGALALDERCYNEVSGVSLRGGSMETLLL
ncbi:hypothetical protein SDC9_108194 [bioreactor metagenome]|uniref:Uncharacterized protein n=1 Tax=bioreactor metagenome TaxID=1076179 RepID=A0A645B8F1_9ZZZZ